ncbi:hypothetical protein K2173_027542 [Erythroxylum novogranatense]|uniref:Uncharacterized protein n=1 Tax=Erythroxylum novogranatense TaxID=1862640 RepID=A0AAV8U2V5_9ROSI|nr:hypothetical protein K2173_027542 [Erythroxylum novogranatense]
MSFTFEYFSELSSLWQELDYYQDFQAQCADDAVLIQNMIEKERVYDFLAGLNSEFDQLRVQVIGRSPFPSLEEAHSYIQQEETRRSAMLYFAPLRNQSNASDKDQLICDYCGKPRHSKETCWKLHGRPARGRGKRANSTKAQANVVETVDSSKETVSVANLSPDEIQHFRQLLSQFNSSSGATSNFVKSDLEPEEDWRW